MIVKKDSHVRVLCGGKARPGVVTCVFQGSTGTRYEVTLDNGSCLSTTIDRLLEP
jgi:hypothetical protein